MKYRYIDAQKIYIKLMQNSKLPPREYTELRALLYLGTIRQEKYIDLWIDTLVLCIREKSNSATQ